MKVSLIVTVLNEAKTISNLLDSLVSQSLQPDEVIFVDAGSKDKTVAIIKSCSKKIKNLKVYVKKGANRSVGRNAAIKRTTGDIIAVTDAGCQLDKNWFSEITKPLAAKNVDVVAGYYLPRTETIFQRCVAPYFCVLPEEIKKKYRKKGFEFLPSSRSLAFRKSVWEQAGGYPEKLNYCEDLVFDQKIKKVGFKIVFNPKAIVYWPQKKSLPTVFWQFYHYAYGDGQVFLSPYQTHSRKILFLYLRYFSAALLLVLCLIFPEFWLFLFFLSAGYLLIDILLKYRYVKNIKAFLYFPVLRITADSAVMLGALSGILNSNNEN